MARKRKAKVESGCIFGDSDPVFCNNMCQKHYFWDRYHTNNKHGAAYFFNYVARHKELAARGTQVLGARGASQRHGNKRKRGVS